MAKKKPTPSPSPSTDSGENIAEAEASHRECERALLVLRKGNHAKALRLIKDLCVRHPSSAVAHIVQGDILCQFATVIDDLRLKHRHLKSAAESMQRATLLSPDSIEFGYMYASVLFDLCEDGKAYEEVVQECKRALSIKPKKESPIKDSYLGVSIPVKNLMETREALFSLMKICSLSDSVKNLENADEEEKLESIHLEGVQWSVYLFVGPHKPGQRKEYLNEKVIKPHVDQMEQIKTYWNSIDDDKKRGLLKVRICDLKAHFESSKDDTVMEILSEAIGFAEENKSWSFLACCHCDEKFGDIEPYRKHINQKHMGSLSPELCSVMPQEVDRHWADMIVKGRWKPVDIPAALKTLDSHSSAEGGIHKWPLSDDSEREKILEEIHVMFKTLLRRKYLAASHLSLIMEFTVIEMQANFSASQLLTHACGIHDSEKIGSIQEMASGRDKFQIKERVVLSGDSLILLLDKRFLGEAANAANGWAVTFGIKDQGDYALPETDSLVSWRKCEQLGYAKALESVESISLKEYKDRKQPGFVPQSYESLLERRREELEDDDAMSISVRFELDVISNILKEAQGLRADQLERDQNDLESDEDDGSEEGEYVLIALSEKMERHRASPENRLIILSFLVSLCSSLQLCKLDARIMQCIDGRKQLEFELAVASSDDYRLVMVILLKLFIRAHLGELAEKYAKEKYDATTETMLAQLAIDAKKLLKRDDYGKQTQGKSKHKKMNKYYRKAKHLKVLISIRSYSFPFAIRLYIGITFLQHAMVNVVLEYQRRMEDEAKQKHLAEKKKKKKASERLHSIAGC
ncbi:hypothetical protein CK203_082579 [Vitis vinifera]|uniref:C2H2-type domain-containing protein n=1 Tax=Vitis vinifera TaxID=29760 RepID=A0A438CL76_VITVI|nr:hypothetical protein CK203_082579 [Vitis vinifera]